MQSEYHRLQSTLLFIRKPLLTLLVMLGLLLLCSHNTDFLALLFYPLRLCRANGWLPEPRGFETAVRQQRLRKELGSCGLSTGQWIFLL